MPTVSLTCVEAQRNEALDGEGGDESGVRVNKRVSESGGVFEGGNENGVAEGEGEVRGIVKARLR